MNLKLIPQLAPHKRIGEDFIKILWLANVLKNINWFAVSRSTKFVWQKKFDKKVFPSVNDDMKILISLKKTEKELAELSLLLNSSKKI